MFTTTKRTNTQDLAAARKGISGSSEPPERRNRKPRVLAKTTAPAKPCAPSPLAPHPKQRPETTGFSATKQGAWTSPEASYVSMSSRVPRNEGSDSTTCLPSRKPNVWRHNLSRTSHFTQTCMRPSQAAPRLPPKGVQSQPRGQSQCNSGATPKTAARRDLAESM